MSNEINYWKHIISNNYEVTQSEIREKIYTDESFRNIDNWKPKKHYRSIVYYPYYYVYYNNPYFESKYISCYDKIYDPPTSYQNKIILKDGTTIETFGNQNSNIIPIIISIILFIFIIFFIYNYYIN